MGTENGGGDAPRTAPRLGQAPILSPPDGAVALPDRAGTGGAGRIAAKEGEPDRLDARLPIRWLQGETEQIRCVHHPCRVRLTRLPSSPMIMASMIGMRRSPRRSSSGGIAPASHHRPSADLEQRGARADRFEKCPAHCTKMVDGIPVGTADWTGLGSAAFQPSPLVRLQEAHTAPATEGQADEDRRDWRNRTHRFEGRH